MDDNDDKLNYIKYFIVFDDAQIPQDTKTKKAI